MKMITIAGFHKSLVIICNIRNYIGENRLSSQLHWKRGGKSNVLEITLYVKVNQSEICRNINRKIISSFFQRHLSIEYLDSNYDINFSYHELVNLIF